MKHAKLVKIAAICAICMGLLLGVSSLLEDKAEQKVAERAQKVRAAERKARRMKARADRETAEKLDAQQSHVKAGLDGDKEDEEEAALTAEQKKLLAELRAAADADNLKALLRVVTKMQAHGFDGVPAYLQKEAIDALSWFDSKTVPELFGFLGSADSEVTAEAASALVDALDDISLSDRERAQIVVKLTQVVTDQDTLEDIFTAFDDMRNSVAVSTFKQIMQNGTEEAKAMVGEAINDFTDEENIRTEKELDDWLKNNPDDEDDEEFYGGDKDDDDDDE